MKILVITRAPWRNDNGIGNTLTDFFSNMKNVELYGLCMREAREVSPLCIRNFYFSEQQFIRKIVKGKDVGFITCNCQEDDYSKSEKAMYNKAKKTNSMILNIIRELLWNLNFWKNQNLKNYLDEVKPDIVFFPDFPCIYAHKVYNYVLSYTKAKGVIYHVDDCYTLRRFSFSPLFWIDRLILRKWVRLSSKASCLHYAISEVQKEDYDKMLGVNHKVLTKFGDFSANPGLKDKYNFPLRIVYTGQIEINRWKSLKIIVDALKVVNANSKKAELFIYTGTEITKEIEQALNVSGSSYIVGKANAAQIPNIQKESDILVHVESFDLKNRLKVRQSFSTKIVDYMKRGRAILAVGPKEVASIRHLIDNDCAIYADNSLDLVKKINEITNNPAILDEFAKKAYLCGREKHNRFLMEQMLYQDLRQLYEEKTRF